MRTYRLPNGGTTASVQLYHREWETLAEHVCPPGWRLDAYDPDLHLVNDTGPFAISATLPVAYAYDLARFDHYPLRDE